MDLVNWRATTRDPLSSAGLLVLRVYLGCALLVVHGVPKLADLATGGDHFLAEVTAIGFPAPHLFAWIAAVAQAGGALSVLLGFGLRAGALAAASTIAVGLVGLHAGDPFREVEAGVMYVAALVALVFAGPGRYSVDGLGTR